ncbi:MAG: hypothetical protein JWR19_4535 [Pedosphaera sp.]|nr:hypothetical protein [Pedosphaera sp.]
MASIVKRWHWTADFQDWRVQTMSEPFTARAQAMARETPNYREQVAGTAVVLLALNTVVMVALLMGHGAETYSLHPVWQIILGASVVGIFFKTARMVRLIKGRQRPTAQLMQ